MSQNFCNISTYFVFQVYQWNPFFTYKQFYFKQVSLAYSLVLFNPLYQVLPLLASDGNKRVLCIPQMHYWSLTISLFSIIYRTLVGGVLPPLQRCSQCILQSQPIGLGLVWFYDISTTKGYLMPNPVFTYISNIWFVNTFYRYIFKRAWTHFFCT